MYLFELKVSLNIRIKSSSFQIWRHRLYKMTGCYMSLIPPTPHPPWHLPVKSLGCGGCYTNLNARPFLEKYGYYAGRLIIGARRQFLKCNGGTDHILKQQCGFSAFLDFEVLCNGPCWKPPRRRHAKLQLMVLPCVKFILRPSQPVQLLLQSLHPSWTRSRSLTHSAISLTPTQLVL